MRRKFLGNLILLLVLNLLVKPFWILGIDRTVQNTVGTSEYGFYFAVLNFSFLFNILLDFGVTTFNNRNIAQNQQLVSKHLSRIIILKVSLFFVYLIFTFSAALFIDYSPEQIYILFFLALNQFILSFILYLRSNLSGLHLFKTDSIISVMDRTLLIVVCGVLLWGNVVNEFRIQYFVYAQTVSYAITAIIALFLVLRKAKIRFPKLTGNLPFIIMILRQSFPFALLVLLMAFHNRIDSVMLERMLDEGAKFSGIYASAFRLLDAANMFAFLFALLLLPIFARMLKNKESVEGLVNLSYTLLIVPAIILSVASYFYSEELMLLLYTIHEGETASMYLQRIHDTAMVFRVLMACFCAISTMYIFGTLLTANGNLKILNIIALGGIVINITLNIILIPKYQAYGSALATLVTQFVTATIQVIAASYIFRFQKNYWLIIRFLIFLTGVILSGYLFSHSGLQWHVSFVSMMAVSLLFAILIQLIRVRNLMQILKFGEKD